MVLKIKKENEQEVNEFLKSKINEIIYDKNKIIQRHLKIVKFISILILIVFVLFILLIYKNLVQIVKSLYIYYF